MVMRVKARFNGGVFVPQEPVDLPEGQEVSLSVEPSDQASPTTPTPLLDLIDRLDQMPGDPHWPEDAAAQHDHYLEAAERRNI